jgi:hypothetical protein
MEHVLGFTCRTESFSDSQHIKTENENYQHLNEKNFIIIIIESRGH